MELIGCALVTDSTGVMLDQSAVVAHSQWIARALEGCLATDRHFTLLTPTTSRITLGLSTIMAETGSRWVVSDDGQQHHDGVSGDRLVWDGQDFEFTMELGDAFLRFDQPTQGGTFLYGEAIHPPRALGSLGSLTAGLCRFTTGEDPVGWGVLEPASEPWDASEFSAHALAGLPRRSVLHVVGRDQSVPFTAAVTIDATPDGIRERVQATWPEDDVWGEVQRREFQDRMLGEGANFAVAYRIERGSGLFRAPRVQGITTPMSAFIGPRLLTARGADAVQARMGDLARPLRRGPWQSVGVTYRDDAGERPHPVQDHAELIVWLGGQ